VKNGDINLYVFLGRSYPWSNEASPDVVTSTVSQHWETWNGIYALKRVSSDDVSLIVPRVNWEKDSVYDEYDSANADMFEDRNFYVLVADDLDPENNRIYKCIANGSSNESTIEPESDVPGVFGTSYVEDDADNDGYSWILVGEFNATEYDRFLSTDWFPVRAVETDDDSLQWDVQDSAIAGGIHVIKVATGGSGYTDGTHTLEVTTPDSTGTGLIATVVVSAGVADEVTVLTAGTGYRDCVLKMPAGAGGGSGATFRPILSPYGGHGFNIINELKPNAVCVYGLVGASEEGKLVVTNDFRQYGIVVDPRLVSDGSLATGDVYYQHSKYTITAITNNSYNPAFTQDEWVFTGNSFAEATAKGKVLGWDVTNPTKLYLIAERGTFSANDVIRGVTSETVATISTRDETPQVTPGSGEIVYLANRSPVSRNDEQKEELKMVVTY